jgi:gp36.2
MVIKMKKSNILRSDVLYRLITSKYWNTVEGMLKQSVPRNKIVKWLRSQEFEISEHSIGKLVIAYKNSIRDKVSVQSFIVPTSILTEDDIKDFLKNKETVVVEYKKIKNDREVLDRIIQKGFNHIENMKDEEITIPIMFQTIELKERLLSNHNTIYGEEVYQELELGKYAVIITELLKFVPEKEKELVIQRLKDVEEQYYRDKGFYEEYKQSKQQEALKRIGCDVDD